MKQTPIRLTLTVEWHAERGAAAWRLTLGAGSRGSGERWGDDPGVRLAALRECADQLAAIIADAERALPRPGRPLLTFEGHRAVLTVERPAEGQETPTRAVVDTARPRY
jgi:hypothetical protein